MSKRLIEIQKELDDLANLGAGVYAIKGLRDDLIKIGMSRNIEGRLSDLQRATPHKLRVLFFAECRSRTRKVEAAAHNLLGSWRVQGEWFRVSPEMAQLAIEGARDECIRTRKFFKMQSEKIAIAHPRRRMAFERRILEEFPDLHDRLPVSDCEPIFLGE